MDQIQHAFYINLDSRPDRREHVEAQLKLVGINSTRFRAIRMDNGAVGCSMSHLKCLEIAKDNNWEHVLIVEDDITFLDPVVFVKNFTSFLNNNKTFDVALLAGNNVPPYVRVDETCIKVTRCQTTTGYIVKRHYYDTLIKNIREGILNLMHEPDNHVLYAIDKFWFRLQEKDNWYLITPPTVVQREDYSDIEKRPTNYIRVMTDLDKHYLYRH
jgi:glycosyl transferase family 25